MNFFFIRTCNQLHINLKSEAMGSLVLHLSIVTKYLVHIWSYTSFFSINLFTQKLKIMVPVKYGNRTRSLTDQSPQQVLRLPINVQGEMPREFLDLAEYSYSLLSIIIMYFYNTSVSLEEMDAPWVHFLF